MLSQTNRLWQLFFFLQILSVALLQLGQIGVLCNNDHDGTMTDGTPLGPRALSGKEHEISTQSPFVCYGLSSLDFPPPPPPLFFFFFLNICHNRLGQKVANFFWIAPDSKYFWLCSQSLLKLLNSAVAH